jgi:glycosyltransferase involved in cell wall biosynthesis
MESQSFSIMTALPTVIHDGDPDLRSKVQARYLNTQPRVIIDLDTKNMRHVDSILQMKEAGKLRNTKIIMGSYKTIHRWTPQRDIFARWVVHCNAEIKARPGSNLHLILLTSGITPVRAPLGEHFFVGGRKHRDLQLAVDALEKTDFRFIVVSDKPVKVNKGKHISTLVSKPEYARILSEARGVLIPTKPILPCETKLISRGHADAVRAIMHGKPIITSQGAGVDDYVLHGSTGLVIPHSVDAWVNAVIQVNAEAERMADNTILRQKEHTPINSDEKMLAMFEMPWCKHPTYGWIPARL